MKYIIAILLAILCASSLASDGFSLKFTDDNFVIFDKDEWVQISEEENFDFFLSKTPELLQSDIFKVHSMVEFREEEVYTQLKAPVKRIFSWGIMDCNRAIFHLMGDFYVDKNNEIIFASQSEFRVNQIELRTPNTARNKAYNKVCTYNSEA